MKTILGIRLYQPSLSDEEYIDAVRTRLSKRRRHAIFFGAMGLLQMSCFLAFCHFAFDVFPHDEFMSQWLKPGFFVGLTLGVMAGICIVSAASCVYLCTEALRGNRTEQLLVKYHDGNKGNVPTSI